MQVFLGERRDAKLEQGHGKVVLEKLGVICVSPLSLHSAPFILALPAVGKDNIGVTPAAQVSFCSFLFSFVLLLLE